MESDMADKWADYLISAVRYNSAETHIDEVEVREDKGENAGLPSTWERSNVVSSLEGNYTFMTIVENSNGRWDPGADVGIVTVGGTKYIRTDADATAADNLGELPGF
jgi:Protein of unknown function (DUF3892)